MVIEESSWGIDRKGNMGTFWGNRIILTFVLDVLYECIQLFKVH